MLPYALTIFLSAFLLFLVQPLIAKQILPWFGGAASVWTTCLLFFQSALLAGYAYADASVRWLRPRQQVYVHAALMLLSLGYSLASLKTGSLGQATIFALARLFGGFRLLLAAAALRCVGGQIEGKLLFRNDDERARAHRWGIEDLDRIYKLDDLAKGDCIFAATGVTDGSLLKGVKRRKNLITTESIVMRASSGTVRRISGEHRKGV